MTSEDFAPQRGAMHKSPGVSCVCCNAAPTIAMPLTLHALACVLEADHTPLFVVVELHPGQIAHVWPRWVGLQTSPLPPPAVRFKIHVMVPTNHMLASQCASLNGLVPHTAVLPVGP
jgi:hypothetical protein